MSLLRTHNAVDKFIDCVFFSLTFFFVSILAFGCASPAIDQSPRAPLRGLSVAQGYTNATSAQFTLLVPKDKTVRYFVRAESAESELELRDITIQHFRQNESRWSVDRVTVGGLELNRTYRLEVRDAVDSLIDAREFHALDLNQTQAKIAAVAGLGLSDGAHINTNDILIRKPDILFLLGNNVDVVKNAPTIGGITADIVWASYVQSRLTDNLYRAPRLVPILATWGESEYASTEAFRIFFSQEPDFQNFFTGPGVAHFLSAFNINFIFTDSRTFRTPRSVEIESYYGAAQERWMINQLKDFQKPVWLIDSTPFFKSLEKETSFEATHENNFEHFFSRLGLASSSELFLSGEVQTPDAKKITLKQINRPSFSISTQAPSYVVIETQNKNGDLQATVTAYGRKQNILYHRFISVGKKFKTY